MSANISSLVPNPQPAPPGPRGPNTGVIASIDYVRNRLGQIARDFGGARVVRLEDGRVLTFSEGDMAYRGLNFALARQQKELVGRRVSWSWWGRHLLPANLVLESEEGVR